MFIFLYKRGWLYQISRGIDSELVMPRVNAHSIGCSKNFMGKQVLNTTKKVSYWISNLIEELVERLNSDKDRVTHFKYYYN